MRALASRVARSSAPLLAALLGAASLGRCSLLHLDNFALAQCASQMDCEGLNTARGLGHDVCTRYVCRPNPAQANQRTCVLGSRDDDGDGDPDVQCPGGTDCDDRNAARSAHVLNAAGETVDRAEQCDGQDNNCNGVVDEQAGLYALAASQSAASAIAGLPGGSALQSAGGSATTPGFLFSAAGSDAPTLYEPAATPRVTPLVLRAQMTGSMPVSAPTAGLNSAAPAQCFDGSGTGNAVRSLPCGAALEGALGELDAASSLWLYASPRAGGCGNGNLRLGLYVAGGTGLVDQLGPPLLSPIAGGAGAYQYPSYPMTAGMRSGGACTGNATGRSTQSTQGASRPTVTPLGANPAGTGMSPARPQALVTWLGRPRGNGCGAADAPVEALLAWSEEVTYPGASAPLRWVSASNSGLPFTLGTTASDAPVAVVPVANPAGFVVLFPASGGTELAVNFVAALDTTQVQPLSAFLSTMGANNLDAHAYEVRPTPNATTRSLGRLSAVAGMGALASVSAAARGNAGAPAGSTTLGVAWQQGCGIGTPRRVYFQRVDVDATSGSVRATDSAPQLLGDASTPGAASPSVVYSNVALLAPGSQRGSVTVGANTAGGWLVGWLQQDPPPATVQLQRFSELDGQPVDAAPARAPSAQGVPTTAFALAATGRGTAARLAVQTDQQTVEVGAVCRGATP